MTAERRSDSGVEVRGVIAGAATIGAAIVLSLLSSWGLIARLGGTLRQPRVHAAAGPRPALEAQPVPERRAYEERERRKLAGYAWIDREKGIVHVPIETAMLSLSRRAASDRSSDQSPSP